MTIIECIYSKTEKKLFLVALTFRNSYCENMLNPFKFAISLNKFAVYIVPKIHMINRMCTVCYKGTFTTHLDDYKKSKIKLGTIPLLLAYKYLLSRIDFKSTCYNINKCCIPIPVCEWK